jgi:aspartyl-tRNA(Asn)/glutamyl-tRNA(Gln) amidotransferase subunit B
MTTATPTNTQYETVIGLEIHVQLNTASKLFSSAGNRFGDEPNTNTAPVCMALPGTLPVLNAQALEKAVRIGLALNCEIAQNTKFDRKQYFYPDLPKAYQISQYDEPVCGLGHITLSNGRKVGITRAHLEEDAGKLVHAGADGLAGSTHSLVDLNRCGAPLVEIVSEPDMRTAQEAREYMTLIRQIVRYLGVCDGNLEEGSMRCDANVSIRPIGSSTFGTKVETKNMNSFRSVERAIEWEVARQIELTESGKPIAQETRLWNEATGTTAPMRSKEEAHDYRYFPEPDMPPLWIDPAWVEQLADTQPELPHQRIERLTSQFGLSPYDATVMTDFKELGDAFSAAAQHSSAYKTMANYLMGNITGYLKTKQVDLTQTALTPEALAQLADLTESKAMSSAIAKQVLPILLAEGGMPKDLMASMGLSQINDTAELEALIAKILADNPGQVEQYRGGRDKLFGFFVGQAMKVTGGRANPETLNTLIKTALDNPA